MLTKKIFSGLPENIGLPIIWDDSSQVSAYTGIRKGWQ